MSGGNPFFVKASAEERRRWQAESDQMATTGLILFVVPIVLVIFGGFVL